MFASTGTAVDDASVAAGTGRAGSADRGADAVSAASVVPAGAMSTIKLADADGKAPAADARSVSAGVTSGAGPWAARS